MRPIYKSKRVSVYFLKNNRFLVKYKNVIVIGKLFKDCSRTKKLLLAMSVDRPFRELFGMDKLLIFLNKQSLLETFVRNFPNSFIFY